MVELDFSVLQHDLPERDHRAQRGNPVQIQIQQNTDEDARICSELCFDQSDAWSEGKTRYCFQS